MILKLKKTIEAKVLCWIFIILSVFACKNQTQKFDECQVFTSQDSALEFFIFHKVEIEQDMKFVEKAHFSSSKTKDNFTLVLPKGSIIKTKMLLTITNSANKVIYLDSIATAGLINAYALEEYHIDVTQPINDETTKKIVNYLIEQAKNFLPQGLKWITKKPTFEDFLIQPKEHPTEVKAFPSILKSFEEKRSVFEYKLGTESHFFLIYDSASQKVIMINPCC